jgi:hypothetical protein
LSSESYVKSLEFSIFAANMMFDDHKGGLLRWFILYSTHTSHTLVIGHGSGSKNSLFGSEYCDENDRAYRCNFDALSTIYNSASTSFEA